MSDEASNRGRRWKTWRKRLLRVMLFGLCLLIVVYGCFRFWQWVVVPKDAPIVGVSLDTAWHAQSGITTTGYQIGLTRAGAKMLDIRPGDADPNEILDSIDALLLAGGGDVDPTLYDGDPQKAELVDRKRDEFEMALIRGAVERKMPILGICRGIQIVNVLEGGTLRNLRDESDVHEIHGITLDSMKAHAIDILPETRLATILGSGRQETSSFHAQAVGRVGAGLTVSATASDGLIEAVEIPDHPFAIFVQWHPEVFPQQTVMFESLVEAANAYRRSPRSQAENGSEKGGLAPSR